MKISPWVILAIGGGAYLLSRSQAPTATPSSGTTPAPGAGAPPPANTTPSPVITPTPGNVTRVTIPVTWTT